MKFDAIMSGGALIDCEVQKDSEGKALTPMAHYAVTFEPFKAVRVTKSAAAMELGQKGGLKGGPARASKLSAERRSEIALNAARKRWGKSPI